jgi:aminomethyltransferase
MGQITLRPKSGNISDALYALETLVPVDIVDLPVGRQRYALFTNDRGGILDDLMVTRFDDHLFLVVNAACKADDLAHLQAHIGDVCAVEMLTDRSLIALQGPQAEAALAHVDPTIGDMRFMDVITTSTAFGTLIISRSGYTGEDGFEISVTSDHVESLARHLLTTTEARPIGLGARDSLRLEAGLCLYGSDIDTETTPVEASLTWAIQTSRRSGGARAGGFPGAETILRQLAEGTSKKRIGVLADGRAPMRAGVTLYDKEDSTAPIGTVTSGAFGPSLGQPMSMAYVTPDHAQIGHTLWADIRGKRQAATVAKMPFHPAKYKR